MTAYRISTRVNDPGNDEPSITEPYIESESDVPETKPKVPSKPKPHTSTEDNLKLF